MPEELRVPLEALKPDVGASPGSGGRVNVPNPAVSRAARLGGIAGCGLAGVNVLLSAADIASSDNPTRTAMANGGAMTGGWLGGAGGGILGVLGGPAAPVTVPAGALAGSVGGGIVGYEGGERLYDFFNNLANRRR